MTAVLFEPHHDDAVLFACYTLLREKPVVVTVLAEDTVQTQYGIDTETRKWETKMAMAQLGLSPSPGYIWFEESERTPDWDKVENGMRLLDESLQIERVWAPMPEPFDGHEQHDKVGQLAWKVFPSRVRYYATYQRGSARTHTDTEVTPEPGWPATKFKAMACYTSQINLENCRPWFTADDMLREWIS